MNSPIQKYLVISILSLALLVFSSSVRAQLSPGELARSHSHLKGISNCTKCHDLGEKVSSEKCLACHLDLKQRIDQRKGYHSSKEVTGKACTECHSDHHGLNFQMIRFDTEQFDHSLTGYDLHGAHSEISCNTCHKLEFIKDSKIRKKATTYLGLDQKCLSCHADYHQGTLSSDCASCHDFKQFRPASNFDHTLARYPLKGKHTGVECKKCHKVTIHNGKEMQKFSGIAFGKCTHCHTDVHKNKFGQNCTNCHSVESFLQIRGMKNFNHSLTNYPLEGKHRNVSCNSCHKNGYTANLRHNNCSSCHTDYHKREFMKKGKSPDCTECHSVHSFTPSGYTIERHNRNTFQLAGAHLATPCFECHKKNNRWTFRELGTNCADCHEDIHIPFLDQKYYPESSCENCHQATRWSEITFDHTRTGYRLEGAHKNQSCKSCHFRQGEQGRMVQQFSQLSSICTDCHLDVHQKQFEGPSGTNCLKCHDYFDWKAGLFNHDQTAFPLDGKHREVACYKCHPRVINKQLSYTQYKLKSITCESCH